MITIITTVTDLDGTHTIEIGQAADMATARQIVDGYFHYTVYEGADSVEREMINNVRYNEVNRIASLPEAHEPGSWDTDSGLGIGGIGNDQSMPVIPSARGIARVQRMMDTDTVCCRCGASRNFDGAMFSTVGGNICDDCA